MTPDGPSREYDRTHRSTLSRSVVEPVASLLIARHMARVVFEKILQVRVVERESFLRGIGILAHAQERQGCDVVPFRRVEVHIFLVAVCCEEVVSNPTCWKRGELRGIVVESHLVSRAKYSKFVVKRSQQREHIAVASV